MQPRENTFPENRVEIEWQLCDGVAVRLMRYDREISRSGIGENGKDLTTVDYRDERQPVVRQPEFQLIGLLARTLCQYLVRCAWAFTEEFHASDLFDVHVSRD